MVKTQSKRFLPVLLFSGLFSFFLWQIYFVHNNLGYYPLWHGHWITSSQIEGDVFYFRKKFNLSENIKSAWLLVSASDSFEAYLNGREIGREELYSWFPVYIYDVTERINLGANELAIRVEKRSFAGPTKVAVELGYEDAYGNKHYVFSDETWRVSNKEEKDSAFGFLWNSLNFNDAGWVNAEALERPKGLWLNIDPRVYTTSPNRRWFWAGEQKEISCQAEIYIPKKPRTAWVRLASRGGFRFLVNKSRVDVEEGILGTEAIPKDVLKIYEIGPFLRRGNNTILIFNYVQGPERGLYLDGIIERDGWSKTLDENDFKCFYLGDSTPLQIYNGDLGWVSIKNRVIKQDTYIPMGLSLLSYFVLILIFCISSGVFIGLTCIVSVAAHLPFYSLSRSYFIPFLFLMFIYILRYDVRFYTSFPFQGKFVMLSLCLLFLLWLISPLIDKIKIKTIPAWVYTLAFILILITGVFLRFNGISRESLYWDEAQMVVRAQGVLDRGYPSLKLAPELPVRYISTSELVSYLQALSFIVLGKSEFSLRLPSALFGILTIPLLYYFGRMIGGEGLGLLASATYSFLPSAIGMSQFGRYPSPLAFFSFLTGFLGFIYLKTDKYKYLYLCYLSLLLTYFSWQGAALIILPLLLMRILMKKERIFRDIKIFLCFPAPIIAIHLLWRFLELIFLGDFLFGPSISEVAPALMFLSPVYDPFFYVPNFFFILGHQFLSILFFAGIPLVFMKFGTYKNLLFLYMIPLLTPFVMSNVLEIANYRYVYYLLPYLILCACGVLFVFLGYLGYSGGSGVLGLINSFFTSIMLITISCGLFVNFKNFPGIMDGIKADQNLRYFPEVKEAVQVIKPHIGPGDIVISYQPHLLMFYLNKVDYFFESRLQVAVIIVPRHPTFIPVHYISGVPAFLSLNELKRIISSGKKRVWLFASPQSPYFLDKDSQEFIDNNKRLMFERYITQVYLIGGG